MTQYEKQSLALLSTIASGISFQLTALNPNYDNAAAQKQSEQILEWQKSLCAVLENIAKLTDQDAHC